MSAARCNSKARTCRFLLSTAILGSVTLWSPSFVEPRLRINARVEGVSRARRRAAKQLQLPEVNYFTFQDISDCIEEGCTIEQMEELDDRLARDEARIHDEIEVLKKAAQMDRSANILSWLEELRRSLSNLHDLRAHFNAAGASAKGLHDSEFSKGFIASLFFGSGKTAGYLKRPAPPALNNQAKLAAQ